MSLWDVDRIMLAGAPASLRTKETGHLYGASPTPDVRLLLVRCEGTRSQPFLRVFSADNLEEELWTATAEVLECFLSVDVQRREVILPALFEGSVPGMGHLSPDGLLRWFIRCLAPQSRCAKFIF